MYCIAFNGPPRSGKDTIADLIDEEFALRITPTIRKSMVMPVRLAAFAMAGLLYSPDEYERIKDEPLAVFDNHSIREFMINLMENHIKPCYGEAFAAKSMIQSLGTSIHLPGICLVSDLGFQIEVAELESAFGMERVLVAQLERDGVDWGNDSRSYVKAHFHENTMRWWNREGEQDTLVADILTYCENILGWEI